MKLVVDANILFSALIKDSLTAEIISNGKIELFAPEFLFQEFEKYSGIILRKTSRTRKDFSKAVEAIKETLTIIPQEDFQEYIAEAKKICPDPQDTIYFALALKLKCPIWSNDKELKKQELVKIHSTHELIELLLDDNHY